MNSLSKTASREISLEKVFIRHPEVTAGFTRRWGGFSEAPFASLNLGYFSGDDRNIVEQNWNHFLKYYQLSDSSLSMPRLMHGDQMVLAGQALFAGEADAIYTRERKKTLAVTMADCLGILLYDPTQQTIAAIHAGWKGTRAGVLEKTLGKLITMQAIVPETTQLAFSPCLQKESLEINAEIANSLDANFITQKDGHYYFDMPGCNVAQALRQGLLPSNLHLHSGCTLTETEKYFSYRGEGPKSGRMAAIISLA